MSGNTDNAMQVVKNDVETLNKMLGGTVSPRMILDAEVDPDEWSSEKLGSILKEDCKNASNDKVASIHLFGIRYGRVIVDNDISLSEIIQYSEIEKTYRVELQKAINTYKLLKEGKKGVTIIEHHRALKFHTGLESEFQRNRIVFGAPGTGKSFTINRDKNKLVGEDNAIDYERVTFHPDYSYASFVGTYKPVKSGDDISYEYVPGPFMRMYVKALKNGRTDDVRPQLLIIEEINRANVAAVFGDVFQLLDRDKQNVSEYPIQTSKDMRDYLAKELGGMPEDYSEIKIPDNLFIWATMNSADQGVFMMDTAFKRRWDFTYIGIDDSDDDIRGKYVLLKDDMSQKVEWNELRKAINQYLANNKINEDKQLGPYFLPRNVVIPAEGDEINRETFVSSFKNKVLMYLFEDAGKRIQTRLFEGCPKDNTRYSGICKKFDEKGVEIFNREIVSALDLGDKGDEGITDNE